MIDLWQQPLVADEHGELCTLFINEITPSNDKNRSITSTNTKQTTPSYSFETFTILDDICHTLIKVFEHDCSEDGQRFSSAFRNIIDHISIARDIIEKFMTFVHEYDFDENTPANGYRSMIKATQACIDHSIKVCKYIAKRRGYLLRKHMHMKEVEACCDLLVSLCTCLEQLLSMREESVDGSLFPPGEHKAIGLFKRSAEINLQSFYGRCIGFHYCESIQSFMKLLGIGMAGFSEVYYNGDGNRMMKAGNSMYTGGKYYWDPELRARRIVNLSQNAGIDFCKAFWSLTEGELMYVSSNAFGVQIKVNRLIKIPPEPLYIENVHNADKMVEIPLPTSHLGVGSVTARLLSNVPRKGMIGQQDNFMSYVPTNCLIFHCHGGGFVAHSSKSHEVYLREWAARLHVPILSIDYSLSPEAPYPRALEEVFYAYCWAIKNAHLLGTTAETIIVTGDSAGATLSMALTLKCIEHQIRRPDGVFLIYGPMNLDFVPSPSRTLCVMDVLLPFGFLMNCLKAYVHPDTDQHVMTNKTGTTDDNVFLEDSRSTSNMLNIRDKIYRAVGAAASSVASTLSVITSPTSIRNGMSQTISFTRNRLISVMVRNPAVDYQFDVPKDPFLSPVYASDETLKQMPPIKFLSGDMDAFLDDTIEMAKRFKKLGISTGLDVLPGLSHGFLGFMKVSKEAYEGNHMCITRLAELLGTTVHSKC